MSEKTAMAARQWVSLPGGSLDVRLGTGVIDGASALLKGSVGRPRIAALMSGANVDEELTERLRRQLTDAGFQVTLIEVPAGPDARTLEASGELFSRLAEMGLTADDLIVATGDADVCSVASYVATQWCAGTTLVTAPTTQLGLVEAAVTPRPMDVGDSRAMLSVRTGVKHVLFDTDVVFDSPVQEDVLMSRVLMVVTAMCDSEKTFERLWDRAEALCAGDAETLCEQLRDTVKTRGKILSSTALALRQSLSYGEAFARALMGLDATVAPSTARAEALRFQARLAAGEGMFAVDDVLAQDELLEMLELPVAQVSIAPDALIEAVRKERFKRSNRFLLGLPRKLGRVRLAAVTDELIAEHVAAWCASREG